MTAFDWVIAVLVVWGIAWISVGLCFSYQNRELKRKIAELQHEIPKLQQDFADLWVLVAIAAVEEAVRRLQHRF
ncbi:MAG: hypothetical protein AAB360_02905 [Patescibacteria group bacterium]